MSAFLDKMRELGCDADGAIARLIGNEDLLRSCIKMVFDDAAFDKLRDAVTAGDARTGFESAHLLKGITANVGLTPLFKQLCDGIVEPLRAGNTDGLLPQCDKLIATRDELIKGFSEYIQ